MTAETTKSTTRTVDDFSVTTQHRYDEGEPETAAWIHSPNGVLLADGLWTGHLDQNIVAGSQVDAWIRNAQFDDHVGCGWVLDDREC